MRTRFAKLLAIGLSIHLVFADNTAQTLPFSQDWTNIGLITANDNWSGVPGIAGYRGDSLTSATGTDPQTILAGDDSAPVLDVNANQTNPDSFTTGGVTEFHLTNPTIALTGSGTADAPYILINLNTTGKTGINVSYNLRDIEATDNAVQPVALHYRIGTSGNFTNIPAAFVADATTSAATLVTPVAVTLPAAAENQPVVQLRIMTTNAVGNDEWVGIDDILITDATGAPVDLTPTTLTPSSATVGFPYTSNVITASNGVGCTFSTTPSNALSSVGLALTPSGNTVTVTGTPTAIASPLNFAIDVNCTTGGTDSQSYSLTINPLVTISCGTAGRELIGVVQTQTGTAQSGNHVFEGVVVGDYQATGFSPAGFYLQDADGETDGDPFTSDGIFVATTLTDVAEGQRVRVQGPVTEAFGRTRVTPATAADIAICSTGSTTVTPTTITLPVANIPGFSGSEGFEAYEGMLVRINQPLTVTGNFDLGRFGGFELAPQRVMTFTQVNAPSVSGYATFLEEQARTVISLDDRSEGGGQYTATTGTLAPYPAPGLSATNLLRVGSTVATGLTGVVDYSFSRWRLQPVAATTPSFTLAQRPAAPPTLADRRLRIGSANMLNYFNGDGSGGGFPTSRGAETFTDFQRQRARLINALLAVNYDVLALVEMENDGFGSLSALQDLIDGLNAQAGAGTYAFVNLSLPPNNLTQVGTDAITNAIIHKPARVIPVGNPAVRDPITFGARPTIAQRFAAVGPKPSIQTFTLAVVHYRSKGCSSATGGNLDQNDGAACYNADRVTLANDTRTWLLDPTSPVGDPALPDNRRILIVGDYNAYRAEDPITSFTANGFINLFQVFEGPAYFSYQFGNQSGALDHALSTRPFDRLVTNAFEHHINADEPVAIDYNTQYDNTTIDKPADYYNSTAGHRAADHDPLAVEFNPLSGDFDNDGDVDAADSVLFRASLNQPVSNANRRFDMDGDGRITLRDSALFTTAYRAYLAAPIN